MIRIDNNGLCHGKIHMVYSARENEDKLNGEFVNEQVKFDHFVDVEGVKVADIETCLEKQCRIIHQKVIRAMGTPGMKAYANKIKGKAIHFSNLGHKVESEEALLKKVDLAIERMNDEERAKYIADLVKKYEKKD